MIKKIKDYFSKKDEKTKAIFINVFGTFIIKGLAIIISLLTMPAYIKFFDNQVVLGMWFTAISMLSWIATFDLGIGNGLRNYLVKPLVENDKKEIKTYISSAYISILIIVILISVIGIILIPNIDWNIIFNINKDVAARDILQFMVTSLFIGMMINFVLNIIKSICYALQKSTIPNLLILCSNILMLLYVALVKSNNMEHNIKALSVYYIFANNISYIIATIIIFRKKLKNCMPSMKFFKIIYVSKILKLGTTFLFLQGMSMLVFGINEFLISYLVNPESVVIFQVYNKLFTIISTFFNLGLTPVWSAVREACVKKDINWIKKLYKKLNTLILLIIPIELILICCSQVIINMWLGKGSIIVNYYYVIIYAIYSIIHIKVGIDSNIVAGLGKLKVQSITMFIAVITKVILTVILIKISNSWIIIIIANALALIPYIVIEYFDIKKQIYDLGGNSKNDKKVIC